jgi:hypothetical protein
MCSVMQLYLFSVYEFTAIWLDSLTERKSERERERERDCVCVCVCHKIGVYFMALYYK